MPTKKQGCVKWFDSTKGFGFITEDNGEDYFVHYSEIITDDLKENERKNLKEGDKVLFEAEQAIKGEKAVRVAILSE